MRVSVVVCTLNRAEGLRATLECLTRQRGVEFEVVVVNGPSTDHTADVLDEFAQAIRAVDCPMPNLSMSRNIGIRAAAGDIVAFIDDDALPEFEWLRQAVPAFSDPEVAGAGGVVFDHTGYTHQYHYSSANRFGEPAFSTTRPYDSHCIPGSFTFPYLQGTNALFRRSTLLEVGGFDETYDYYLDETDLCCRLIDAGYVLRQLANAPVHHKFLPSDIRDHQRIVTNWFPIVKNNTYFAYRHALGWFSEAEVINRSLAFVERTVADAAHHEEAGRLPTGSAERARTVCGEAFGRGVELGRAAGDQSLPQLCSDDALFRPYPVETRAATRRYAIISGDFTPRITGGIARIMSELAPALAARGHEVRVLTRSETHSTVDLEGDVWVHRLAPASPDCDGGVAPSALRHINEFATAAAAELDRIGTWAPIDLVYAPAWDVESLAALRASPLPVVTMIATPVSVAAAQHSGNAGIPPENAELMRLEGEVFRDSDLIHGLSRAIVETVGRDYGAVLDRGRTGVIPLGLPDHGRDPRPAPVPTRDPGVLFVGRLEPRKGVTDFFHAIELLAPDHPDVNFVVAGADTPLPGGSGWIGERWVRGHRDEHWFDRVTLTGSVPDERLHELYAAADIVVLPSRYESFGLVVVEAMMHGKPIVTCRAGGIPEVVVDGTDAVLVAPADAESLAAAIAALVRSPERRAELGRNARSAYLDRFTIERCAAGLDEFTARLSTVELADYAAVDGPVACAGPAAGHASIVLEAGACATIAALPPGAFTLPVETFEDAVLAIEFDDRTERRTLDRGGWQRLRFGTSPAPRRITVLRGSIRLSSATITAASA